MTKNQQAQELAIFIGKRIRTFRKANKFTQKQLASSLNISYQQLQNYEYGNNPPSIIGLNNIAKCLGVNPGEFFPTFIGEDRFIIIEANLAVLQKELQESTGRIIKEAEKIAKDQAQLGLMR